MHSANNSFTANNAAARRSPKPLTVDEAKPSPSSQRNNSLSGSENLTASERRRRSTTASLNENFATFKRLFGARNELALRRLDHDRLVDAATSMYRMIETAIAEGTYTHSPGPATPHSVAGSQKPSFPPAAADVAASAAASPMIAEVPLITIPTASPDKGESPGDRPPAATSSPALANTSASGSAGAPGASASVEEPAVAVTPPPALTPTTTTTPPRRTSDSVGTPAIVSPAGAAAADALLVRRTSSSALLDIHGPNALLTPTTAGRPGARPDVMTPLSARSNVDPRVVNGSFYGDLTGEAVAAMAGTTGTDPLTTPDTDRLETTTQQSDPAAQSRTVLTADAIRRATSNEHQQQQQPRPNHTTPTSSGQGGGLIPGLRVAGASDRGSLSGGDSARTDDSMADTKFSRSMASTGDVDELFDAVNDYVLMDEIGRGQTGRVMRAVHAETAQMYAIKIIPRGLVVEQRRDAAAAAASDAKAAAVKFKREVKVLKRLKNKRIVRLLEVIDDPGEDQVFLVMPLIENGPMLRFNDDRTCDVYSTETAARYVSDIASGLQYLKRHRIVHRDLKPDNILLTEDDRCVLVDFGQSEWGRRDDADDDDAGARRRRRGASSLSSSVTGTDGDDGGGSSMGERAMSNASGSTVGLGGGGGSQPRSSAKPVANRHAGTPAFMAPEVIDGALPDYPADVWALGVIIYAMLYGRLPFRSRHGGARGQLELFEQIVHAEPPYSDDVEYLWNDLIQACLQKVPAQRIALADVRRHPALQSGGIALGARSSQSSLAASDFGSSFGGPTPTEFDLDEEAVTLPARRGRVADPRSQQQSQHPQAQQSAPPTGNNQFLSPSRGTPYTGGGGLPVVQGPPALLPASRINDLRPGDNMSVSGSRRSSGQEGTMNTSLSGSAMHQSPFPAGQSPQGANGRVDSFTSGATPLAGSSSAAALRNPPTPMLGAARPMNTPPSMQTGGHRALNYLASPVHRAAGAQSKYRLSSNPSGGGGGSPTKTPLDTGGITPIRLSGSLANR